MNETHLIDGAMGRPHVNALDVRMHNAAMFGDGVYITEGLDGLPVTVVDANTVSVGRGVMLINGARITQEEKIDLTIESGSQGMNRNDLLVATYTYDAANTRCEDVNLEIVAGTPTADTATDPAIHAGTLLDINSADLVEGVSTVQVPIARIPLTGTTVGTPVILAKKFGTIQDIRDSVSQTKTFYLSSPCMTTRGNSKAPVQLNVCGNFCALYINAITTRTITEFTELVDSDGLAKIGEYLPVEFDSEQQRNIKGENKPVGCRLCGGSDPHLWLIKDTNLGDGSEMRFVFTWVR